MTSVVRELGDVCSISTEVVRFLPGVTRLNVRGVVDEGRGQEIGEGVDGCL